MKELKFKLPTDAKSVSVKVEDGYVVALYEPKTFKFGDCVVYDNQFDTVIHGIIVSKETEDKYNFALFSPFISGDKFRSNSCCKAYIRSATKKEESKILQKIKDEGYEIDYEKNEIVKKRWRAEKNEIYYCIDTECEIATDSECFDEIDDARYDLGNYYKTPVQAEKVQEEIIEVFEKHKND